MSTAENKAVFLSYASQDAAAAKKICDALRAAGVEVWFDQSELRGGDSWDAKIRKQIRECALFVPVISTNTDERGEGYFRLEWKLAVDRSHLMARDQAFLFPIVIDGTPTETARVPEEFHAVQWARLPAGAVPQDLAGRMKALLAAAHRPAATAPRRESGADTRRPGRGWLMGAAGLAALAAAAIIFRPRPEVTHAPTGIRPPVAVSGPDSAARPLVLQGWEMLEKFVADDTLRESLTLAEELAKRALQVDVTNADAWSLSAQVAGNFITTGRDRLPARFAAMNAAAEQAMQLAPNSDEALFARAAAYRLRPTMRSEAERILRDLVQRRPGDHRFVRMLGNVLRNRQARAEALAVYQQAAALPGGDARAELACAETLEQLGRRDEADAAADRSLAVRPTGSAFLFKVNLARVRGDLAAARAELAKVPPAVLLDERGATVAANVWLWSHEPEKVITALEAIPGDDLYNAYFYGPKSLLLGFAHQLAGRGEVAKLQWRIALKNMEQHAAADPMIAINPLYIGANMFLDYLIDDPGKKAEAAQTLRLYVQLSGTVEIDPMWDPAKLFTLLGRQDIMIEFCEMVLQSGEMPGLREQLRTNKLYDPLRGNPRFEALLVEPVAKK